MQILKIKASFRIPKGRNNVWNAYCARLPEPDRQLELALALEKTEQRQSNQATKMNKLNENKKHHVK